MPDNNDQGIYRMGDIDLLANTDLLLIAWAVQSEIWGVIWNCDSPSNEGRQVVDWDSRSIGNAWAGTINIEAEEHVPSGNKQTKKKKTLIYNIWGRDFWVLGISLLPLDCPQLETRKLKLYFLQLS